MNACVLESACVILRVCVVCVCARVILLRYLLFGLYLNKAGYGLHDDDEAQWFIPHLQTMCDPAKAIGGMLKALRPLSDGGQKQYQKKNEEKEKVKKVFLVEEGNRVDIKWRKMG